MNLITKNLLFISFSILLTIILNACSESSPTEPSDTEVHERGYIYSAGEIATYSPEQINQITNFYGLEHDLVFTYSVKMMRIVYQSEDVDGTPLRFSGALIIPLSLDNVPILSINHGTVTRRTDVASEGPFNSIEGVAGLLTASLGYLTCVPDYPGFGVSDEMHPYVHAKSLAISIIDMLRATKLHATDINLNLSGQLYLTGYSEGGYATLAAHKEIEENYSDEFQITAVAPMAGPYDLSVMIQEILEDFNYKVPAYIAYFITAYDHVYGWNRLDDFFKSPYANMMPGLFDGSNSYSYVVNQLPNSIGQLLKESFVTNYLSGNEIELQSALEENTLLDWSPIAPIRFFHGDSDKTVLYVNALNAVENLTENGGTSIELVTIEGGTHATAGLPSILGMIDWIEAIRNEEVTPKLVRF